jgi:hypothetical protein
MPSIKTLKSRGLCFYPEISDTKLIFLFNNDNKTGNTNNDSNCSRAHCIQCAISYGKFLSVQIGICSSALSVVEPYDSVLFGITT